MDAIEIALSDMNFAGSTSGGTTTGASSNPEYQSKSIIESNKTQTVTESPTASRSINSRRNPQSRFRELELQNASTTNDGDDRGSSARRAELFSITEEAK